MGYTTEFEGEFKVTPELTEPHRAYLTMFNRTRRMKRDAAKAETLSDIYRLAVGLPIGEEGCYFVGGGGQFGQDRDLSILDYNQQPKGQPGLCCQWRPTVTGGIGWDEGEKFYDYIEWIEYLINHFLKPWGYTLNGDVKWSGEDDEDLGMISIRDNVVNARPATITY